MKLDYLTTNLISQSNIYISDVSIEELSVESVDAQLIKIAKKAQWYQAASRVYDPKHTLKVA